MKVKEYKHTYTEGFGSGERTEFNIELVDGSIFTDSMAGKIIDEEKFINKCKKTIIHRLIDSCKCIKELLQIVGDSNIDIGSEGPIFRKISELSFWGIQDYSAQCAIEKYIFDNYVEDIEKLYCEVNTIDEDEYSGFFIEPEYFFNKNISFLEYVKEFNNGNIIEPVREERVDLGPLFRFAFKVVGGESYEEKIEYAKGRPLEVLLCENDIYLVKPKR